MRASRTRANAPRRCGRARGARRGGATAATRSERVGADDPLLEQFYRSIYLDAFASQREPLDAWQRALRGERPYELTISVVLASPGSAGTRSIAEGRCGESIDEAVIAGGIAYELYPASRCGLVTYMVVAPAYRQAGLGKQMQGDAVAELRERGARATFGEIDDPRTRGEVAMKRLQRNQRWGARVVDTRYIQPALGPGLQRDRELVLIALAPAGVTMAGEVVESFIRELYLATEGGPPDREIAVPEVVRLVQW